MRSCFLCIVLAAAAVSAIGCLGQPKPNYTGPKIEKFTGKLLVDGKSVNFPENQDVKLALTHEGGSMWGIAIKPDGTWEIGWMPIGKYSGFLERKDGKAKGPAVSKYGVPGGLEIVDGQTEYTVELGKNFK